MLRVNLPAAAILFLAIAFLDELVDGVGSAAWPLIRDDIHLTYVQVGLLVGIPGILASFIEPCIGILGDIGYRRVLMIGGGLVFAASLALVSTSQGFIVLLIAWIAFFPASGAFVTLSQASLMDVDPARREQNMARWEFIGSVANVIGPLALTAAIALRLGWRGAFIAIAVLTIPAIAAAIRAPIAGGERRSRLEESTFGSGARTAVDALKQFQITRWFVLLTASDLMLDVFKGFLALYMVDVVGLSESGAALTLAIWVGAGLLGDLILIPLLERVRGLAYLRLSVAAVLALYPAFLIAPSFQLKLIATGLLGFASAGWYSILQGRAYASLPGRSGTVMALGNVFGLAGYLIPLGIGVAATAWGLESAMWILLAGPLVLLAGLPRRA